jgi:hypothetical protein
MAQAIPQSRGDKPTQRKYSFGQVAKGVGVFSWCKFHQELVDGQAALNSGNTNPVRSSELPGAL